MDAAAKIESFDLQVVRALLECVGFGDGGGLGPILNEPDPRAPSLIVINDHGVWPNLGDGPRDLRWKPVWEIDSPADLAKTPGLPNPFTVRDLAAFMAHGVGAFIREGFADPRTREADPASLLRLDVEANRAREAITRALVLLKDVEDAIEPPPSDETAKLRAVREQQASAWRNARLKWGLVDRGGGINHTLTDADYAARLERAHIDVKSLDRRERSLASLVEELETSRRRRLVQFLLTLVPGSPIPPASVTLSVRSVAGTLVFSSAAYWSVVARHLDEYGVSAQDVQALSAIASRPRESLSDPGNLVDSYDFELHARDWLARESVSPVHAAMLLCGHDPMGPSGLGASGKTLTYEIAETYTNEFVGPEDLKTLRQHFEQLQQSDPTPRSLLDWFLEATAKAYKLHNWLEEYLGAWRSLECLDDLAVPDTAIDRIRTDLHELERVDLAVTSEPVRVQDRRHELRNRHDRLERRRRFVELLRTSGCEFALNQIPSLFAIDTATPQGAPPRATDGPRRLIRLKEMGGSVKVEGEGFRVVGLGAVVAQEKRERRPRSDTKTVRLDILQAFQDEQQARREGSSGKTPGHHLDQIWASGRIVRRR